MLLIFIWPTQAYWQCCIAHSTNYEWHYYFQKPPIMVLVQSLSFSLVWFDKQKIRIWQKFRFIRFQVKTNAPGCNFLKLSCKSKAVFHCSYTAYKFQVPSYCSMSLIALFRQFSAFLSYFHRKFAYNLSHVVNPLSHRDLNSYERPRLLHVYI